VIYATHITVTPKNIRFGPGKVARTHHERPVSSGGTVLASFGRNGRSRNAPSFDAAATLVFG
jgi:hypothetical protein